MINIYNSKIGGELDKAIYTQGFFVFCIDVFEGFKKFVLNCDGVLFEC